MKGSTLVWFGLGAIAVAALLVAWQGGAFNDGNKTTTAASGGIAIDPSTGGVKLPTGAGYGPSPLPTASS